MLQLVFRISEASTYPNLEQATRQEGERQEDCCGVIGFDDLILP